jgi:hypothetical protein
MLLVYGLQPVFAAGTAGQLLVDKLSLLFNQMATSPDVSYEQINGPITEMMATAKKAKEEQRIGQEFYGRYTRLLRIIKLVITEDKEKILAPVADKECASFIKDVTGKEVPAEANLASLAQSITLELGNLKKLEQQGGR